MWRAGLAWASNSGNRFDSEHGGGSSPRVPMRGQREQKLRDIIYFTCRENRGGVPRPTTKRESRVKKGSGGEVGGDVPSGSKRDAHVYVVVGRAERAGQAAGPFRPAAAPHAGKCGPGRRHRGGSGRRPGGGAARDAGRLGGAGGREHLLEVRVHVPRRDDAKLLHLERGRGWGRCQGRAGRRVAASPHRPDPRSPDRVGSVRQP